jgi:hypothetical protein
MPEEVTPQVTDTPVPAGPVEGEVDTQVADTREKEDRFAGKTEADLRKIIEDKEKFIGRQADEIGQVRQLKEQMDYLRGALESRQQYSPEQFVPERPTEPTRDQVPAFDFTKPEESVERLVESRLRKEREEQQKREEQRYFYQARVNFDQGMEAAIKENKKLFEGIERDVANSVAQMVKAKAVTPEMLSNPRTFVAAAVQHRFWRGELDKALPEKRQPMSPAQMDTPARTKQTIADDDITLSEQDRKMMRDLGMTEKDAVESIRKGLEMRAAGDLRGV